MLHLLFKDFTVPWLNTAVIGQFVSWRESSFELQSKWIKERDLLNILMPSVAV